jgi:4-amino-4-deoxy-L-arabinose transferase-like glycosyltransferase
MTTLIAEQPLMMAILLGAIAAAAIFGWMQTGKKEALWVGLALLALIPISWYVSVSWVTDREQIREAIYSTAQAVKENDLDRAIEVIEPSQRALIATARADLSRFHFSEARVNQLRSIEMVEGSEPPEAEVDLSVKVVVSDRRGQVSDFPVLRRVILKFRKSADGNWYVYNYNHMPIIGDPDGFSPNH